MKFATEIQTTKSTRSPIYGLEEQLLSNHNHIHNSHNIYDWLIETYHGDYKKKKNVERKKEKADLKQRMPLLWLPRDTSPFHADHLKFTVKLWLAESYPHLPDMLLREMCHLFYINDTMPRTSHLWDNGITFDIPANGIK